YSQDLSSRVGVQAERPQERKPGDEVVVIPERGPGNEEKEDADFEEIEEVDEGSEPIFHVREGAALGSSSAAPVSSFKPRGSCHHSTDALRRIDMSDPTARLKPPLSSRDLFVPSQDRQRRLSQRPAARA